MPRASRPNRRPLALALACLLTATTALSGCANTFGTSRPWYKDVEFKPLETLASVAALALYAAAGFFGGSRCPPPDFGRPYGY